MERALQLLKINGQFALLTQGTYIDKEWAKGLRKLLASKAELDYIVDMNPFGQLFFTAMNSLCELRWCFTQNQRTATGPRVMSEAPSTFGELNTQQRREKVVATVRNVL